MPLSSNLRLRPDQQAQLQRLMMPIVSAVDLNGRPVSQGEWDKGVDDYAGHIDRTNRSMDAHNKLVRFGQVASAVPLAFAAAPAFGAGAGASSGAASAGSATTGATTGLMGRLGKIFSSAGFETGTNAALSLFGMRSQNKANTQARADAIANQTKMIEMEQSRLAQEAQNANLDREDARALNAAIQDLEKKKFALQQEQALFERGVYEKEQAVKDNYRSTIQEPAAQRLRAILGLG